ncbi:uncharacterized protein HMPREF1541_02597 [Cyphellophora europaea CBS 101466]|uniref:Uncharacterized protein n=1 Tax=Cyphellophora europaea (strain CBS 101466) TaxID=1220924 RepID=W2S5Y9_CYPE1|nr:uncharacterized protein HMPREF1541_02597 [Cyphellophora europaea CBS 101466]ETN43438.1 hypothetical protein HMPREF1541_02597 [Cyphellophora europaea CBS 101466]
MRIPPPLLAFLTAALLSTNALSARLSATSFCKCVCFNNSTIIALNPPDNSKSSHSSLKFSRTVPALAPRAPADEKTEDNPNNDEEAKKDATHHHKPTCADCNRAFCLSQGLKICEAAKEEDVFATCFQRDSLKDELVVILFVACTGGLLAWALVKPWVHRVRAKGVPPAVPSSRPRQGIPTVASGGSRRRPGSGATRIRDAEEEDEELLQPTR